MSVRLSSYGDNSICVQAMKDGQLGIVTEWDNHHVVGSVVQRHGNILIVIGMGAERSFTCLFSSEVRHMGCRVRLLKKDEHIVVEEN